MQSNPVHAQTGNDVHASVGCSPDQRPQRVLLRGVPSSRDQHERWRDRAFQSSLEGAKDHEVREVLREGDAENHDTP